MNQAITRSRALLLATLAAAVLAGCGRKEEAPVRAAAPAPAPAAAPEPAAAASGPIIPPLASAAPTDAQRNTGATIAAQGVSGAPACNSCHGAHGEGNAAAGFPRIAGQSHIYLLHELESYANGSRRANAVMQPIASALSAQQRVAVAAYFASLNPDGTGAPNSAPITPATSAGAASSPVVSGGTSSASAGAGMRGAKRSRGSAPGGRAAVLATVGDESKRVQACANCHGPGGTGSGELFPYLAGQPANYLGATLGAWRDGSRNNDPSGQMPIIAKGLAPADVTALAAYYAARPPRSIAIDAERMAPTGALATANPAAITSGPQQGTPGPAASPAAGTGTEQGAPTTGGDQGAGGGGGTGSASTGAPQGATRGPGAGPTPSGSTVR